MSNLKSRPFTASKAFHVKEYEIDAFKSFRIVSADSKNHHGPLAVPSRMNTSSGKRNEVSNDAKPKTPQIPHTKIHDELCSMAPSLAITKSMAFSRRHKNTTFGKSNRISFLLKRYADMGNEIDKNQYPSNLGSGNEFALGLTLAGSAASEHVLGPVSTYGNIDYKSRDDKVKCNNSSGIHNATIKPQVVDIIQQKHSKNKSIVAASITNMKASLMLDEKMKESAKINQCVSRISIPVANNKLKVNTRYGSTAAYQSHNSSITVQPISTSHYSISEESRFDRTFIDEISINKRRMHEQKLLHHVRHKNLTSI